MTTAVPLSNGLAFAAPLPQFRPRE